MPVVTFHFTTHFLTLQDRATSIIWILSVVLYLVGGFNCDHFKIVVFEGGSGQIGFIRARIELALLRSLRLDSQVDVHSLFLGGGR